MTFLNIFRGIVGPMAIIFWTGHSKRNCCCVQSVIGLLKNKQDSALHSIQVSLPELAERGKVGATSAHSL